MSEEAKAALLSRLSEVRAEYGMSAALAKELQRRYHAHDPLVEALEGVRALIGDCEGVYGLHLNGDPSPWGEHDDMIAEIDAALTLAKGETT